MANLEFWPADGSARRLVPLSPVTTLLVAIMKSGAYIRHDCGGRALCGTCRVEIDSAPQGGGRAAGPSSGAAASPGGGAAAGPSPGASAGQTPSAGPSLGLGPMRAAERERLQILGIALDGRIRLACQTYSSRDLGARGCLDKEDR